MPFSIRDPIPILLRLLSATIAPTGCGIVLGDIPDNPAPAGTDDASTPDGPGVDPCDMDRDGYKSDHCAGGNDCDDTTNQVHPFPPNDPDPYHDMPTHGDAGGGFDYDCNGTPDPEFPKAVDCSLLSLLNCDESTKSFLGMTTPACGEPGPFGHCVKGTVSCMAQVEETNKIMRCR
jgi:hypothetical protein